MKTLITGGAGFLGSHLVEKLLEENNQVIVIDDFSMGRAENLPQHKNLIVFTGSILEDTTDFLYEGIDTVFHLGALTRPRYSLDYPVETNRVNVEGTLKVLMNSAVNRVGRFIFVSSASAYGEQHEFPFREYAKCNPKSPYALTKLIGEQYCQLFNKLYGLKYNIVRPFNIYGKRQRIDGGYASAVPNFIKMLSSGETPFITGDGEQVRDFVYVDDVVDLLIKASKTKITGEIFNAGFGKNMSINELYKIISEVMGKNVIPNHIDPVSDPDTLADITKSALLLGWIPSVGVKEGIERMLK